MPAHLSLVTFVGNVFFLQGILVPSFGTNGPLWSLSYEFWYYIMFPLLLAVFMSSAPMFRRACAVAALIAISVFCGKDISLYFLIWLLGALTYCLPLGISHTLARWITPFVCVLFAAFNVYAVVSPYNIVASDFTTGIFFSALLWLLLHFRQPARESLYRDAAKRLSAMSYTLYTVQYPIVEFFSAWLITNWSSRHLSLSSLGALLATYAATFSIAYLLYRCFEANTGRIRLVLAGYLVLR
jgi:peptidoglycan/LPS O-acetylase OafA/YrhL